MILLSFKRHNPPLISQVRNTMPCYAISFSCHSLEKILDLGSKPIQSWVKGVGLDCMRKSNSQDQLLSRQPKFLVKRTKAAQSLARNSGEGGQGPLEGLKRCVQEALPLSTLGVQPQGVEHHQLVSRDQRRRVSDVENAAEPDPVLPTGQMRKIFLGGTKTNPLADPRLTLFTH